MNPRQRAAPGRVRIGLVAALRARILALAQRRRRYDAGMIHLRLRQAGERVNAKRVHRLYVEQRPPIGGAGARRCPSPSASRS